MSFPGPTTEDTTDARNTHPGKDVGHGAYRVLVDWTSQGMKWLDTPQSNDVLEFPTVDAAVKAWLDSYANMQKFYVVQIVEWEALSKSRAA